MFFTEMVGLMPVICEIKPGDRVFRREDTIIVEFSGLRRVLSTARVNGGCREDLEAVFNHHIPPHKHNPADLEGGSVEGYLAHLVERLGLPHRRTAGLLTAAGMENAAVRTLNFRELEVTAVITAGVDVNGGRAGDPAPHYEINGQWSPVDVTGELGGTINIMLFIDGSLPPHVLARSIITATEAKAAALQELMAPSRYSRGIATGSGTDQIIVASNVQSPNYFSDAGKHSKLGELIGAAVRDATKEALEKQTGLNPERQCSVFARLERYGITGEDFWRLLKQQEWDDGIAGDRGFFREHFLRLERDERLVCLAASVAHLLDEYEWGLLPAETVVEMGARFIHAVLGARVNGDEASGNRARSPESCPAYFHEGDPARLLGRLLLSALCKYEIQQCRQEGRLP
jgi:adenosylcobinamide amidohydrolase